MPSSTASRLYARAITRRNLTIFVAIVVALPTAYAFRSTVGHGQRSGGFLLLLTLAVGVPTAYDEYWPDYDRTWKAVAWVLVACTVATAEFVGIYLAETALVGLPPVHAAVGAVLVTDVGNLAWLSVCRRR